MFEIGLSKEGHAYAAFGKDMYIDHYPHLENINVIEVNMTAGDCLYVPAYYYIQSETIGPVDPDTQGAHTMIITHEYEAHSKMIDMIFDGVTSLRSYHGYQENNLHKFDA